MVVLTLVISVQYGVLQHLASRYNVITVVMIHYWFFDAFVVALAHRQPGGFRQVAVTPQLPLQIFLRCLICGAGLYHRDCFGRLYNRDCLHSIGTGEDLCGFPMLPTVGRRNIGTGVRRLRGLAVLDGDWCRVYRRIDHL